MILLESWYNKEMNLYIYYLIIVNNLNRIDESVKLICIIFYLY